MSTAVNISLSGCNLQLITTGVGALGTATHQDLIIVKYYSCSAILD